MSVDTAAIKKPKTDASAMAFHADDGDKHVVGIGNLRVILCNDNGIWFAQGLEIDYAANGNSQKEVKKNFETGLKSTIGHHLQVYGNIRQMLIPAPAEVWQEFGTSGKHMRFSQVSVHEDFNPDEMGEFPYSGINYIERTSVAA